MISSLERLWKDKMDIYRFVETVVNGITKSSEQLIKTDVKCKYSKSSLTDTGTENGIPRLVNSHTLFCGLDTDIKEGDKVIVTQKNGRKVTLTIGEGFPYPYTNRQEFSVKRDGTA